MKKGIKESNVQRMRNIVSGNYTAKTKILSGYNKQQKDYVEGDIWEEKGKTWTIKRGIRRTINKMDAVRSATKVPMCCPKCDNKLIHKAHKAMFRRWGMCLTCVTKWEHQMKEDGTYDDWFEQFDETNFNAFIKDVKHEYEEWLQSRNAKHFISEAGDIEDWGTGTSNEELTKQFNEQIKKALEKRNGQK